MYNRQQRDFKDLSTGDVFKFKLEDFDYLAKHPSIKELFKEFYSTKTFKHGYWAILNKPCDMIETKDGSRTFDTNILLCPLRGFKSALKENILKGFLQQNIKQPRDKFLELFKEAQRKNFNDTCKNEIKDSKERDRQAKEFANGTSLKIKEITTTEPTTPPLFAAALLEILKNNKTQKKIVSEIFRSAAWEKYTLEVDQYSQKQVSLKLNRGGIKNLANLCLNQFDSKGIFFYEPHKSISSKEFDLIYIVKLDEMISFKIKPDLIHQRKVSKYLKKKKILGLKENFSDRLLNIMGNYFSKIGTADVPLTPILQLYKEIDDTEVEYDEKDLSSD